MIAKKIYVGVSVILAQEYCKTNKQLHIDRRDEDVKTVKEETAQQILNLRKRYAIKLATLSQGIPFIAVVKDGDFFTKKSAEFLSLPVGKGDGSATQFIEFGKRSSQHAIITGATGSGKSTLLHTLIMSSLINYSPDELNLYLMDFKSGTEFKIYETVKVPHIKLLALDALQEFGESILMELVEEQNRRSQLFKDNGEHTSIKSFVSATGQVMPRILVVMDEFQILFNDSSNRKVAQHCAELANKIVTEGRAFGIHLIMATQTLVIGCELGAAREKIKKLQQAIVEYINSGGASNSNNANAYARVVENTPWNTIEGEHTIAYDLQSTNPNYAPNSQWAVNCQRCVPAYEMRRRGYDVTAMPKPQLTNASDLAYHPFAVWENPTIQNTTGNGRQDIEQQMAQWGDGARAQVMVIWDDGDGGHTFIAEQENGRTRFIDPQTGSENTSWYFSHVQEGSTRFCRIDNLNTTNRINDCCREAHNG